MGDRTSTTATDSMSFVAITGHSQSPCGYCHSQTDSSAAFGLWAYALTPHVYQDLIDHGWRRSGKYLYRPATHQTCCPAYTIRLPAVQCVVSRSHKKVLHATADTTITDHAPVELFMAPATPVPALANVDMSLHRASGCTVAQSGPPPHSLAPSASDQLHPSMKTINCTIPTGETAIPGLSHESGLASISGKRITKRDRKRIKKSLQESTKTDRTDRTDKTDNAPNQSSNTCSIMDLIQDLESEESGQAHRLKVILEPAEFTQETFDLYKKYQIAIHKDPPSRIQPQQFIQFLVDSPIVSELINDDALCTSSLSDASLLRCWQVSSESPAQQPCASYGSFHQKYYIDNILVAVAVLDILPKCVSSVYFMYDPDYSFLSLGTYSALREIALTNWLSSTMPQGLDYYYMGYYIHSCVKMRYKASYKPSEIMCPEIYRWVAMRDAVHLLEAKRDTALADASAASATTGSDCNGLVDAISSPREIRIINASEISDEMVADINVLSKRRLVRLHSLRNNHDLVVHIKEFFTRAELATLADRLVFVAV
ncbi:hypothetical protein BSLG_003851 [Batrachochytrium salamandrivorans]|nr:hypothetical protein BSLG_003851 [Batrachochytrium salamandrivorans]